MTQAPKHTPGPWRLRRIGDWLSVETEDRLTLAQIEPRWKDEARLMAAAYLLPELRKLLIDAIFLTFDGGYVTLRRTFEETLAQLDRALDVEGETK